MSIENKIRVLLLEKIRKTRPKVWPLVVAQVWNKVDEKVHYYCTVNSKVSNSVILHLIALKKDNT